MKTGRATINIRLDCPIDNQEFDDVLTEIITSIHGGKMIGEGLISKSIYNYEVDASYIEDFRVEQVDGKQNIIFQSKMNKK